MNLDSLKEICQQNQCICVENEPMSAHTTFRIGGNCRAFITMPNADACAAILQYLRDNQIKFRVIGRGSNLLVHDEGYDGVILTFGGESAQNIRIDEENAVITCGAGVPLKALCLAAQKASLAGLAFAYGIPGSVGGAVFMNAGAYGGEISQIIQSAKILDDACNLRTLSAEELSLSYRHSILTEHPDWILTEATFALTHGNKDEIRADMEDLLGRRQSKQPLEFPSAGSTFKRPEGSYASMLIDQCGLKGYTVGSAQVSEKHAGFVINRGNATFSDVMQLCENVRETVQQQTGFVLELEPEIL